MTFSELAKTRYSVRNYEAKPVEDEKLLHILEAGRVAPTAANKQPQRILVVRQKEGLDKLKQAANIFNAPMALIICGDRNNVWVRPFDQHDMIDVDASIVTDHMMLQATELGLGTLWIAYFKPQALRDAFQIPEQFEPVSILLLGYAAGEPKSPDRHAKERQELHTTVFYESFPR